MSFPSINLLENIKKNLSSRCAANNRLHMGSIVSRELPPLHVHFGDFEPRVGSRNE